MRDTIIVAVISAMTSGGVLAFIQFLITRNDDKQGIKSTLKKLEKDGLRTQLLLMILMKPEEKKEILTLAQHYFVDLEGNWYMTDIFKKWLKEKGHSNPEWFNTESIVRSATNK